MTADRWSMIERLFHETLARPADERAAYLSHACDGDDALRRGVESLIARDGDASFLSMPAATFDHVPAIQIGHTLGPYVVSGRLGEGGMGEVYRARDTTLGRDVAIKVLPAVFASDPERLARFEREARVLAALNHPHIGAIYGVEKSAGLHALVMELVEGEDLSQRIARGAIPLDEALPIAKQIADALEAAHEQGIIHRDLKPANIKVRPDGTVKVLDFGLAKAMQPAGAISPSNSMSPTITTPAMTQAGMILGTAAYMSPEQARGKTVDKRADIWAFGCVLFEMLTAQRAFWGENITDTIVSIVRNEPDWGALPALTSVAVRSLLCRCLDKDSKRRLRDIGEARLALDGALETTSQQTAPPTTSQASGGGRLAWMAALAVAAVSIVTLAVPTMRHLRETPPAETRTEIVTPASDDPVSFALSPDGRQIVFVASSDGASRLWLRSLASTTAQPLAGTEGAAHPFWKPDSRSVGFFAEGKLKKLDIGGGAPQPIAAAYPRGGSWNADGVILFPATAGSPLFRVPDSGGQAVAVTRLARQSSHRFPFFLPDGRQFLFYAQGGPEVGGIYLGSLDTADSERLAPADAAGVYLPTGWLLWVRAGTLVAQRLDVGRKTLSGNLVSVADSVVFGANTYVGALSVSTTGLVAYRSAGANRRQLTWVDRSGKALGTLGTSDDNNLSTPSLSPDGGRVAVSRTVQGNTNIWLLDGIRTSRFTSDAAVDRFPIWSRDGSQIVFESNRKGPRNLYRKLAMGGGLEELLLESPQDKTATDWSVDGRFLLYHSTDPQTSQDLWVLPMEGDRTSSVFLKTSFDERNGQFSPDGRWVAYRSNVSGRVEIYIRPFALAASGAGASRAGEEMPVSTAGGIFPRWGRDGKELYYLGLNGEMMAAPITATETTLQPGAPVPLFSTRIYGGGVDNGQGRQYDVARDGRFLINTVLDDASGPITLLQNWNPELKK